MNFRFEQEKISGSARTHRAFPSACQKLVEGIGTAILDQTDEHGADLEGRRQCIPYEMARTSRSYPGWSRTPLARLICCLGVSGRT